MAPSTSTSLSPLLASSTSTTSSYGKACTNCSKAKCKCSYIDGHTVCERCERLKKLCQPLVPARKRVSKPTNNTSTAAKHQRLEQKLDSLVSLLQAQGTVTEQAIPSRQDDHGLYDWQSKSLDSATPSASIASVQTVSTAATSPSQTQAQHGLHSIPPTFETAQVALEQFRDQSLCYFPFMYIPPHMTAMQLNHDFPLLSLSISVIAAKSMSQLGQLSQQIQRTILDKLYVEGERSLDLLLALLSYTGWFRHQRKQKPFFNMWTSQAAALATELGYTTAPPGDAPIFCHLSLYPYSKTIGKRERTMPERRAVLGTYLMSSWVRTSFRKTNGLAWTSHLDECLRELEEQPEWRGDTVLALQVRCELIKEQVFESPWNGCFLNDGARQGAPEYFIKSLNAQLKEVKKKVASGSGQQNDLLRLFVLDTELTINEAAQELPISPSSDVILDYQRMQTLHDAVDCIKAWFKIFNQIPYNSYPDITFSLFSQVMHALVSLFRLSSLDDPAWDRTAVKKNIDLIEVIENFASNIDKVKGSRALIVDNEDEDMFAKSAAKMRRLGQAWATEIAAVGTKANTAEQPLPEIDIPAEFMDLDLLDTQWADLFLSWDH